MSTEPGYQAPSVTVATSLPKRGAGSSVLLVPVVSTGDEDRPGATVAAAETFLSAEAVPSGTTRPQVERVMYEIPVPGERQTVAQSKIQSWLALGAHPVQRAAGKLPVDVRPFVEELVLTGGVLRMTFLVPRLAGVRPRDVLQALHLADLESQGCVLTRTQVELRP